MIFYPGEDTVSQEYFVYFKKTQQSREKKETLDAADGFS